MSLTTLIIAVVAVGCLAVLLRLAGVLAQAQPRSTDAVPVRMVLIFFLTLIGLGLSWEVGYEGIWYRLETELQGTITARLDFPQTRYTHRPTTAYKVQRSDGSLSEYTALHHNDFSLPRTLPVGASIVKRKGELSYTLNGQRVDDFPLPLYLTLLAIGLLCLAGAIVLTLREQKRDASRVAG